MKGLTHDQPCKQTVCFSDSMTTSGCPSASLFLATCSCTHKFPACQLEMNVSDIGRLPLVLAQPHKANKKEPD